MTKKSKSKRAAKKMTTRTPRAADNARITRNKANPFREGSTRHAMLELAVKSGTLAKFKAAKGALNYLSWYRRNGLVKIEGVR